MIGDLTLERRLQHSFGQLLQQITLTDQIQALGPSLLNQPADQLLSTPRPLSEDSDGLVATAFAFASVIKCHF